jgi:hypothetical protein
MKTVFFFVWLGGGGLVIIAGYVCLCLIKSCEARHDSDHDTVWNLLLRRDRP